MAYFRSMRPQAGFRGKAFSADCTMEGPVFGPFDLSVVVSEVLLEVGELDEGPAAVREVALVGPFP